MYLLVIVSAIRENELSPKEVVAAAKPPAASAEAPIANKADIIELD
jgi:hypothetical protein